MYFGFLALLLSVSLVAMTSDEDDYSLSGLTQEAPDYKYLSSSSDDNTNDNLHMLFESARKFAGDDIQDFGDAVFDLSQVEKPSDITSSAISVGTEELPKDLKVVTNSGREPESDLETIPDTLPEVPLSKKARYSPEVSDISDSELVQAAENGEKGITNSVTSASTSIVDVFAKAQSRRCLRKKAENSIKPHMNPPRTALEMSELTRKSLQPASLSKIKWATNAYQRWIDRKQIFHARNTASFTRNNRVIKPLHEVAHDITMLKEDLCDFIVEIRKENGDQYPGNSLHDLLQGLSLYLQHEKGFSDRLISDAFSEIKNTLDNMMKERSAQGIGKGKECDTVSAEHEQILWDKNVLGESNPDQLRKTVFFLLGCCLGLRGIKEHHDLHCYPDSQINIIKVNGQDAIIYHEFASKTRQGGLKDGNKPPLQVCYAFCSGYCPRCIVELVRKYLSLGPRGSKNWPKFYRQTDPSWTPGSTYWYSNRPVGKNTIAEYLKSIMEAGGIEGYYRNHSLRKATATRLFEQGVDPQLIQEQTGHKSNAVMLYKKSNLDMKKVSDMLNVLPSEMQFIRDREKVMLNEGKDRKKPAASVSVPQKEEIMHKEQDVKNDIKPSMEPSEKQQVVVDTKKGVDVHVPVVPGFDLSNLSGLVNIHFHFHAK